MAFIFFNPNPAGKFVGDCSLGKRIEYAIFVKGRWIMFKKWFKAALIRALKTMSQTAVSLLTVGQALLDIDWLSVLSVSAVAGVVSILTSIAGLPEVKMEEKPNDNIESGTSE